MQTPFATLKGSVNPEGVPTTYYFQYGTTTNWNEYSTPPVEIGSGTSPLSESASISGLAGGTTYYFRIVATSAIGTSAGGPVGFAAYAAAADGDGDGSDRRVGRTRYPTCDGQR